MSNFQFLQDEWSSIYSNVKIAEERVFTEPVSCAGYCRMVLEGNVKDSSLTVSQTNLVPYKVVVLE
ncbi:MAG: hypothetical protein ACKO7P_12070 [Bacteroidota bacterium]